jgi:plasmid maintenance system antidote protein VapI
MASGETVNEYVPDVVAHPRETLKELMEEQGLSVDDLVDEMDTSEFPENLIRQFFDPKFDICLADRMAHNLSTVFSLSASFWLKLESLYRRSLIGSTDEYIKDPIKYRRDESGYDRIETTYGDAIIYYDGPLCYYVQDSNDRLYVCFILDEDPGCYARYGAVLFEGEVSELPTLYDISEYFRTVLDHDWYWVEFDEDTRDGKIEYLVKQVGVLRDSPLERAWNVSEGETE